MKIEMTMLLIHMHRGAEQATRKMEVTTTISNCLVALQWDGWVIDRWEVQ